MPWFFAVIGLLAVGLLALVGVSYRLLLGVPGEYSGDYSETARIKLNQLYQQKVDVRFERSPFDVGSLQILGLMGTALGVLVFSTLLASVDLEVWQGLWILQSISIAMGSYALFVLARVLRNLSDDRQETFTCVHEIVQENDIDLKRTQLFLERKQDWIEDAEKQYVPSQETCIGAPGDEWKAVGVHYHKGSLDSLTGRDVTLTFTNDMQTVVTILPGIGSVRAWLDHQYKQYIEAQGLSKTHLGKKLSEHLPSEVLFSKERSIGGMLDFVGSLETAANEMTKEERPVMNLYGSRTEDGSYLLHGVGEEGVLRTLIPLKAAEAYLAPIREIVSLSGEQISERLMLEAA